MERALLIALAVAGAGGLAGYGMGRAGWRTAGIAVAAGLALAAGLLLLSARGRPGFDGIGQVILAVFFAAPAATGCALGLWWGLRRRG
ncbi:MAG: hypothetical protein KF887_14825 [Paracoccaceae bacterium]|nr:MAG: hypothetical protein KF887_14825 [Paracoccaceae bacterium]